jgi:hypothetical protein
VAYAAVAVVIGGAAGFLASPRYVPPRGDPEPRLRERAQAYYRAMRRADIGEMARLETPARQLRDTVRLQHEIDNNDAQRAKFHKTTIDRMERSAQMVLGDKLEVHIEGDWAVTSGQSTVYDQQDQPIPFPLDELVWMRASGDWWEYEMAPVELNAYGNPPDFARNILRKRHGAQEIPSETQPPPGQTASPPAQPAPPSRGKESSSG